MAWYVAHRMMQSRQPYRGGGEDGCLDALVLFILIAALIGTLVVLKLAGSI